LAGFNLSLRCEDAVTKKRAIKSGFIQISIDQEKGACLKNCLLPKFEWESISACECRLDSESRRCHRNAVNSPRVFPLYLWLLILARFLCQRLSDIRWQHRT
jgi:hypothetical protein